jgi:hypothetical protein
MFNSITAFTFLSLLFSSCFFDTETDDTPDIEPTVHVDSALLNDTTGLIEIGRDFASNLVLINASLSISKGKVPTETAAQLAKINTMSSLDPELSELDHKTPLELYNSLPQNNNMARFPTTGYLNSNYKKQDEQFYIQLEPSQNDYFKIIQTTFKDLDFFLDSVVYIYYVAQDSSNWTYFNEIKNPKANRYESWEEHYSNGNYGTRRIKSTGGDTKNPSEWILPTLQAPQIQLSAFLFDDKPKDAPQPSKGSSQWNSSSEFEIYTNSTKKSTSSEGIEYYSETVEGSETFGRSMAYQLEPQGKGKWATKVRTVTRSQTHYPAADGSASPDYSHSIALSETGNKSSIWKTEIKDIYTKPQSKIDYYRSNISVWNKGTSSITFDEKYSTSAHQFITLLNPVGTSTSQFSGDYYERWNQGGSYNHYSLTFKNNTLTKTWENQQTPDDELIVLNKRIAPKQSESPIHIEKEQSINLNSLPLIKLNHSTNTQVHFDGIYKQGFLEGKLSIDEKVMTVEIHKSGIYYLEGTDWLYQSF